MDKEALHRYNTTVTSSLEKVKMSKGEKYPKGVFFLSFFFSLPPTAEKKCQPTLCLDMEKKQRKDIN